MAKTPEKKAKPAATKEVSGLRRVSQQAVATKKPPVKKATTKTPAKAVAAELRRVSHQADAAKKASQIIKTVAAFEDASHVPSALPKKGEIHQGIIPKRNGTYFYANGKRKTSVASVRLYQDGKGVITINGRAFENYFPVFTDQDKIMAPLRMANTLKTFDIVVQVRGGGIHSQAEAVRHGVSKALLEHDGNLRTTLKPMGFLTRDSRIKERKKYGLKRARRAPQFSKR